MTANEHSTARPPSSANPTAQSPDTLQDKLADISQVATEKTDWCPIASAQTLSQRAEILWSIREFFHRQGYDEVQTPTISRDTVVDRYIDPIRIEAVSLATPAATAECYYLQTSPEFCMKRLLAAGMQAIYQLGPAYRAGERGQFHNIEFTMLEWYRVGQTLDEALSFLASLTDSLLQPRCQLAPTRVISYQQAFEQILNLDPLTCDIKRLQKEAEKQHLPLGSSWANQSTDDWLNLLFAECIQPKLGFGQPVIVTHYPASQAALAMVSASDPRTAERYELFVNGIELANGYHELLDADELLARSSDVLEQRRVDGKPDLAIENRLQHAMRSGMPDSCGCALGVDRLVMLALNKTAIEEVIPFAIERA